MTSYNHISLELIKRKLEDKTLNAFHIIIPKSKYEVKLTYNSFMDLIYFLQSKFPSILNRDFYPQQPVYEFVADQEKIIEYIQDYIFVHHKVIPHINIRKL